ncbi:hypothetical protein BC834DRAFT_897849 [Gloeopeniophorella convolvens]|nr:hypothetical protein BC834DRAFT_897849 [Gloeopeniophorella convolvens]
MPQPSAGVVLRNARLSRHGRTWRASRAGARPGGPVAHHHHGWRLWPTPDSGERIVDGGPLRCRGAAVSRCSGPGRSEGSSVW